MNQVGSLLLQKLECKVHCQGETYLSTEPKSNLDCLSNSFFFHDKSIWSSGENISGILSLPSNLPILYVPDREEFCPVISDFVVSF